MARKKVIPNKDAAAVKEEPVAAKKPRSGKLVIPKMSELTAEFFRQMGGIDVVVQNMVEDFKAAPPGSLLRQKTYDMILRVLKVVDARKETGTSELSLVSDEDLERELQEVVSRLQTQAAPPP